MWWILGAWIGYQLIGLALALVMVGRVKSRPNAGEWAILISVWPYLVYATAVDVREQNKEKARLKPFEKFVNALPDDDDKESESESESIKARLIEDRLRAWTRWWNDDE